MISNYKWYIVILTFLVGVFVLWTPLMAIAVLFPVIAKDLHLSVAQAGLIWGIAPAAGVLVSIIGGLLADRVGIRFVIGGFAVLGGIFGALRGISTDFVSLLIMMFVFGICFWVIQVNLPKVVRIWFPPQQLGLANGIVASSGIVGGVVGAGISATVVLSAVGSWQNVLFLYGAIGAFIGILWLVTAKEPSQVGPPLRVSLGEAFSKVVRTKGVWLCGITMLGLMAGYQGLTGYLPMYLGSMGWSPASAGGALSALIGVGVVTVILVPVLSDKIGLRKAFVIAPALVFAIAVCLLAAFKTTTPLWSVMILTGLAWGPIVAVLFCSLTEQEKVGPVFAGTALGIVGTLGCVGGFIGPVVGNALAATNPAFPFLVFGALAGIFVITYFFTRETGAKVTAVK